MLLPLNRIFPLAPKENIHLALYLVSYLYFSFSLTGGVFSFYFLVLLIFSFSCSVCFFGHFTLPYNFIYLLVGWILLELHKECYHQRFFSLPFVAVNPELRYQGLLSTTDVIIYRESKEKTLQSHHISLHSCHLQRMQMTVWKMGKNLLYTQIYLLANF